MKNEMPLKRFLAEEALREGVGPVAIWYRLRQGKRKRITIQERRVNRHVIFVRTCSPAHLPTCP